MNKFDKDSFPEEVFEEKNIVSRTDEIVNVQVIGTSMELDNLVSEVQNNKPIEIVIIKKNKIYFGALDVIENILLGSKFFSI